MSDKGAHFHRCDLQVHTPRDINWVGADAVTDEERQVYARSLVEACRDKGLQGIAITDHHDMLFASYVRRAAQEETDESGDPIPEHRRLIVFPGMELTLAVPCQALLLFDADLPDDLFSLALNALAIAPSPDGEAKTAETVRLNHIASLKQLKEKLDEYAYLRDRYIVFPNITNEGQHSIFRVGMMSKYIEMPWVGGYVDGDINRLRDGIKNRIAGKDKAWGHKRIACFQTSDNRHEDHAALGEFSTWIKWATPTAEALRQACLAEESRVSQEPPQIPDIVVRSISVSNSTCLGPLDLQFNPQYNALIGGRGTGKSTILEYLRWALCDQPPGPEDDDMPNYQARRARLVAQTLKPVKGTVQVRFMVNGVPHVVRRASTDGSVLIKIAADDFKSCTEDEVRSLLPIQAYSQKQLSDVSVRLEELGRFLTAPIRNELATIERALADRVDRIRQAYATRQRHRALSRTLETRTLEQESLQQQATSLRTSLTGLSDEDQRALDQGQTFEAADRVVESWRDGVSTFQAGVEDLLKSIDFHLTTLAEAPQNPEPELLDNARREYRSLLLDARNALDRLLTRASGIVGDNDEDSLSNPWRLWRDRIEVVRRAYEAAVQKSSTHSERLGQLREIESQVADHARESGRITEELHALDAAEAAFDWERKAWLSLLSDRDRMLDAQCERLTAGSDGAIRAKVYRYASATYFVNGLRQALSGSRVHGGKLEALGEAIVTSSEPQVQWDALLDDLETLARFNPDQDGAEKRPDTPALSAQGFTEGELDRTARTVDTDDWLALSLRPIESTPLFYYLAREEEYIPFRNASAGQQATALLKTLLNQAGPPLVIDQPEEDLDNPVMLEIVRQVWTAKRQRQIIFASHNANLVVNGDAELVAWCDYRSAGDQSRGSIAGEGAIDVPEVREAIKSIMEGGEAAFNLRKEKYGF